MTDLPSDTEPSDGTTQTQGHPDSPGPYTTDPNDHWAKAPQAERTYAEGSKAAAAESARLLREGQHPRQRAAAPATTEAILRAILTELQRLNARLDAAPEYPRIE